LRTHKIASIILFQADAADKNEDAKETKEDYTSNIRDSSPTTGGEDRCSLLKFRIWLQLSQELVMVFCVAFLLIICLPVLAFWFMFLGILLSILNIYFLLRRMWRDAHSGVMEEDEIYDPSIAGEGAEDMEFQEFLSNFGDLAARQDEWSN
jgi:hypothetical protein